MNYNTIAFAPTAAAKRFIQGHRLNLRTYGLIAIVAALTVALAAIDWARTEIEKIPEYALRFQIAKLKAKRFFVRRAIAVCQFNERHRLTQKATNALDTVFALN